MRCTRRIRLVVLGCAGLFGAGGSLAVAGGEPPGPIRTITYEGQPLPVREVSTEWRLLEVSRDTRALRLVYAGGGCKLENGRATLEVAGSSIEIGVRVDSAVDPQNPDMTPCTSDLQFHRLWVKLPSPLGGREIEGGPLFPSHAGGFLFRRKVLRGRYIPLVPRVVGLSAADALEVLEFQAFPVRTEGRSGGRVAAQRPKVGQPLHKRKRGTGTRPVVLTLR